MWKRSSSVMPSSKSRRPVSTRNRERKRLNMSHLPGCGVQCRGNRGGQAVPARRLLAKAAASRGGQGVILGAAVVLALAPFGGDEVLMLQAVKRWIERALRNLERIARNLLDAQQHAVSMQRFQRNRFEDQHVECARE